ncbi:hypothetical protein Zm00014a_033730 [Zea mays]|uniref:Uncharacterized protein n=1 Tax=Zea mays TaxID=4577 RepID=A0A3L6EQT0_MAIZE|nr:hypothetical protein Zm00014a_033730 [Zea mays]
MTIVQLVGGLQNDLNSLDHTFPLCSCPHIFFYPPNISQSNLTCALRKVIIELHAPTSSTQKLKLIRRSSSLRSQT